MTAPVVVDEGAAARNRSGKCAADRETFVQGSKFRTKNRKRTAQSRSVQLPTVTIPLQTVPLKINVHVSDVPESQWLEAKIISAQPYYPPTEGQSFGSDLTNLGSLIQTSEGRQSNLDSSSGEEKSCKQTALFDGANESALQGTPDEAVPIEMSGALGTLLVLEVPSTAVLAMRTVVTRSNVFV